MIKLNINAKGSTLSAAMVRGRKPDVSNTNSFLTFAKGYNEINFMVGSR